MKGNVRFQEHQIISELRMRKEYRIADMVEGAFRYYRWQMKGLREKNKKNRLLKVFISNDGKEIKQLYNGEEVDKIAKEREELKAELRDKVDYIHEQDEVIKDYKHRAEVAEMALKNICKNITNDLGGCMDNNEIEIKSNILYKSYLKQAEKELQEDEK